VPCWHLTEFLTLDLLVGAADAFIFSRIQPAFNLNGHGLPCLRQCAELQ